MSNTASTSASSETTADELRELLREAEEALTHSAGETDGKFDGLRDRLRGVLADGKESLDRFRTEAKRQAKRADQLVRSHPYEAIGIAAGVGALIGFLFARSQR